MRRSKSLPAHFWPLGFLACRGGAIALRCLLASPFSAAGLAALATTVATVDAAAQEDDDKKKGDKDDKAKPVGSMDSVDQPVPEPVPEAEPATAPGSRSRWGVATTSTPR